MTSTPGFKAGPPRHSLQASLLLPVCGDLGFVEWEVQSSGTGCGVTAGSYSPLFLTELACVCMSTSSLQKIHCRTGSLCGLWKPQCSRALYLRVNLNPGTSIYATSTHLLLRTNSQKLLVPHLFLSPSISCSRKEFRDNTDAAKTDLLS